MQFRKLGSTGLDVGVIGLGTEYLNGQPREVVTSVVREAIARGVNYLDVLFSLPEYLDNLGAALRGCRERVVLTGHLGSAMKDGQYCKTRSVRNSQTAFQRVLSRLGTDYVDVLFLHNCDSQKEYERLTGPGGLLDLAARLRQEGKARFIGFSGHTVSTALQAVESGQVDVLMFPINIAANAVPGKKDLFRVCVAHAVGLVAMKPFAGGKLLQKERTVRVAAYQMGGDALKLKKSAPITPVQCLSYVLAQVGVSTAVPGCQDVTQLEAVLAYLEAPEEARDFSGLLSDFQEYVAGECVYCNHCLPCPAKIDVGQVNRLVDAAQDGVSEPLQASYDAFPVRASACTECGACVERCPLGVDVISNMRQAVVLFGEGA